VNPGICGCLALSSFSAGGGWVLEGGGGNVRAELNGRQHRRFTVARRVRSSNELLGGHCDSKNKDITCWLVIIIIVKSFKSLNLPL
jgi:hypothetical protein